MNRDQPTILKGLNFPQKEALSYSSESMLRKAREGLRILKNQSWPSKIYSNLAQKFDDMEQSCKKIASLIKEKNPNEALRKIEQERYWKTFEEVIQIIEQAYMTQSHREECQKAFEDYVLQDHDRHYYDALKYRNSLQTLCNPRGPHWADPECDIPALIDEYHTTISEKRRIIILKNLALHLVFKAAQSRSFHTKDSKATFSIVDLSPGDNNFYWEITKKHQVFIKKECLKIWKIFGKDPSRLLEEADRDVMQASHHWLWMKNRLRYLNNSSPHPWDYSPSAILEYLSFLIDRILPLSLASEARKSLVFSQTVQNMHDYTTAWRPTRGDRI